ncbi:MAG TPA: CPBP family intramembrane glutamic endopeptidase, partial [Actinomycetes bacterium]|nr:CPBP family intramembrane glutamic endopeptidase [Actinomycetes bacterium]
RTECGRSMRFRWIATTLAVMLAGYGLIRAVDFDVAVAVLAAVVLVLVGHWSGLSWDELGLARTTWRRGLVWAGCALLIVVGVYALILITPLDVLLEDERYDDGWRQAWVTALLVVPLGTVVWEEVAFRGVLWGQLRHYWSTRVATLVSSLIFGVWHAIPALRFADANEAVDVAGAGGDATTLGTVIVTVVLTGIGGVILCEVRRRSDSLLASIGLHWAINSAGVIAVAIASTR